ncbi:peptidase MA family metallohydrolase [Gracilimonas mengyeensis]|uniref:WD40-like Beta Propeller Repeat n=1 Tax=Gracilimonas mengyeensis TaxID=1302730 RepID=A0A521C507_9BACT|nr:peptidase MA family metallohydrolase [Gracilimonas mengyeensis]SMO54514.1 WD40-like Beta Propeller Repeat [Gracilimonas mengyeensis]
MRYPRFYLFLIFAFLLSFTAQQAFAQYYSFGKNRVQYEDFEWRYIQTTHFDVYYYGKKNYELADFAAKSIESAYKQLSEDFNHQISNRIPLIVYDSHNDFSQTNVVNLPVNAEGIGGVTDKMKNRMTVPFTGDYADFRRTLHHELVHAVFNDMFYGGTINSIIRNNIQLQFPLWFEEGLAEYTALGWDTNTDMYIRDAVINNYLRPIPYLSGYYAYRGGQSVWNYIVEEYGRQKIAEILQNIKKTRSVEEGMRQSLGLNIEELSEVWDNALQERYYPEVAERERADMISTQLTERGEFGSYNTSPAISPQGDKVAFITNKRGYFDVVVISAIDGRKLKTLVKGQDNPEFEELNILNPNMDWSPDGSKVAISTKSKGRDDLAIIDYATGNIEKIQFPNIDAIASIAWSPDGTKIAFDGNIGAYQDIFIYDMETRNLKNLTGDFFSDTEPEWSPDSRYVYFTSDRGDKTVFHTFAVNYFLLGDPSIYQTDIYRASVDGNSATRLTKTDGWSEKSPEVTRNGRMAFISDENGILNVYEYNFNTRTTTPLTNLQTGASQISLSADGSRMAFNSINEGYLDIFLLRSPFDRRKEGDLSKNYWAQRRANESETERVPAILYARQMFGSGGSRPADSEEAGVTPNQPQQAQQAGQIADAATDTVSAQNQEGAEEDNNEEIDFRNYVFSTEVMEDSTIYLEDVENFSPENTTTEDGRFQPKDYRLRFSTDIAYSPSVVASTYGTYALTQFVISDLLGDHQISLGTNFKTDLRNSDYSIQYGYMKNRTNYFASYFHTSRRYQTVYGEVIRFRTFGGGINVQYPFNTFKRIDFSFAGMGITRDYSSVSDYYSGISVGRDRTANQRSIFLYPEVIFTNDRTLPGFITPRGGRRYSVGLSGSPGLGENAPLFASVLGDFRQYVNLGANYSLAFRGSGATSLGRDKQTYFMGGRLGWINQRFSDNGLSFDRLTDSFFTVPALPVRGYAYNSLYGSNFALVNAEFRFPLFAAVVPGAIPILPLYNITGAAFLDIGTAWGQTIDYGLYEISDGSPNRIVNDKSLNFKIAKEKTSDYAVNSQGQLVEFEAPYYEGDILMGAGFGLRTILLGLPFRYDVGWAFDRDSFKAKPIHYFSIGIDF